MAWEIGFTREARAWVRGLGVDDRHRLAATLEALEARGPLLGRPLADRVKGSRHHHLKELRPPGSNLRALYAFDSRRQAVILLGGDKTNNWSGWYRANIARADRLYDQHVQRIERSHGGNGRELA